MRSPTASEAPPAAPAPWRERLYRVIFEHDTPAGIAFDVALLAAILLSVLVVMLDSVASIHQRYGGWLLAAEWLFTVLFTAEYVLRLLCVRWPARYATSFFGLVDLLAVLPTYVSLLHPGAQELLVIRALRLLRVFRIFKLGRFLHEAATLRAALWASRAKITVFITTVVVIVLITGSAMHLIEGPEHGFTSIPQSMYWAIVTMATVGYGDIVPATPAGKALTALLILLGYSLIIVPTGILGAELFHARGHEASRRTCPTCLREGHDADARFCKHCGGAM